MKTKKTMGMKQFPISQNREHGVAFRNEPVPGAVISLDGLIEPNDPDFGNGTGTGSSNTGKTADQIAAEQKAAQEATAKAAQEAEQKAAKEREERERNGGKTDAELTAEKENQAKAVTVDDKTYQLDAEGNALDETGKVVFSKEKLAELASGPEPSLVEDIIKKFGYHPTNEKGELIEYEDSEEGLLQLTQDIAKYQVNQFRTEFLNQNPKLKAYAQHLALGKPDEEFFNNVKTDWTQVKLEKDKESELRKIIVAHLTTVSKLPYDEAEDLAKTYDQAGKLYEKAESSLKKLQEHQVKTETQRQLDFENKVKEDAENYKKELAAVEDLVVKKGTLQDFTIPETERKPFFEYLTKPVKKVGNSWFTQAMIDEQEDSNEINLQLQFLRFKNFKLDGLVKNAATTQQVKSLKERMKKSDSSSNRMSSGEGSKAPLKLSIDDISLDKLN